MARFDVFRMAGGELVVDCQAELLSHLKTRLVVPLMPPESGPEPIARLNPVMQFEEREVVFYADLAAAVPLRDFRSKAGTLAAEEYRLLAALDMLIVGF